MNFSQSKDERLLAFYENVRRQVELDSRAGGRYRLVGEGVKQYAERLREEMDRMRLRYNRIEWPEDQASGHSSSRSSVDPSVSTNLLSCEIGT